jgi:energy-coupling factor transport system ATP-binding protein
MISIDELTFRYDGGADDALRGITLHIEKGGFMGVIGPSGAGKSTLLCAVNGIIPHHFKGDYYGAVKVDGQDTFDVSLTDLSLTVGTVFQDVESQLISAIVEDELYYGLENFSVPKAEADRRVDEVLRQIGIENLRRRAVSSLSGGQKQKVAIAAVLALRPQILLLDEPTGELDPVSSRQIFSLLKTLNEEHGITVVIVEQKIMLLSEFARELAVIDKGELKYRGPVREVLSHSAELEQMGVNCPRVVTLSNALTDAGIGIGSLSVNVDEAEAMMQEVLK